MVNPCRPITRAGCASLPLGDIGGEGVTPESGKEKKANPAWLALDGVIHPSLHPSAAQLALIGREGSLIIIVHWYIDLFNDIGTLHALSEHVPCCDQSEPIVWPYQSEPIAWP